MPDADAWEPACPFARKITGATPSEAGVVCGVMEADQARADPILEGAPIPVVIRAHSDPSTLMNFCCGRGEPVLSPDDLRFRELGQGHHTGCPVYVAGHEIRAVERAFAPEVRAEVDPEAPGLDVGGLEVSAQDLRDLGLDGT